MNALQSAVSLMRRYNAAWEAQDIDGIVALYHDPIARLRSGELVVRSAEDMRVAIGTILPWWTKDGAQPNTYEPLQPLNEAPTTVIVRMHMGEWSLTVPGCTRLISPTFFYVTSQRDGVWKIASMISEWPKASPA